MSEHHEIDGHPKRPDISLKCVFVLAEDLRGHKLERS